MLDMIKLRNRDFINRCYEIIRLDKDRGLYSTTRSIVERTIYGGAPRFYISYSRAASAIATYRRHRYTSSSASTVSQMQFMELQQKVEEMQRRSSRDISWRRALSMILASSGASRFFISVEYGMRLLNRHSIRGCGFIRPRRTVLNP